MSAGTDADASKAARPRSRAALLVATLLILLWQASFFASAPRLDASYRVEAATGVHQNFQFVYFLRYLGLHPVAWTERPTDFSREGAERMLRERGETLTTEVSQTMRYGDLARTYLYLPKAWLTGTADKPTLRPTHAALFTLSLIAVLWAFWGTGHAVLGGALVVLLGSNPFQLYETYANENVFSWPVTTALLLLAMAWPLAAGPPSPLRREWIVAIASGALLGLVRQVRTEPVVLGASVALVLLTLRGRSWPRRIGLAGVLAVAFAGTSAAALAWLRAERAEAEAVVRTAGGLVYEGPKEPYHSVWHTIWCGLGDFDRTHGYAWDDFVATDYARPILRERWGIELATKETLIAPENREGGFHRSPMQQPHYQDVMREKVLADIAADPAWYCGILARRLVRVLSETTPLSLAAGPWALHLPFPGWVAAALLGLFAWLRRRELVLLVLFAVPLSATALLVYSGGGTTWYGCAHLFAAAAGIHLAVEWFRRRRASGAQDARPPVPG